MNIHQTPKAKNNLFLFCGFYSINVNFIPLIAAVWIYIHFQARKHKEYLARRKTAKEKKDSKNSDRESH